MSSHEKTDPSLIFSDNPAHFPCAFCGMQCIAGHTSDDEGAILHQRPECETFRVMEAMDFLIACRRALGIPDDICPDCGEAISPYKEKH